MTTTTVDNRGVIYTRFSRQAEGEKLERQLEMCRAIANQQSIDVIAEITDVESGIKWERPGLKELVRLVEAGAIKHVIAQAKDRLARSTDVNNRLTVLFRRQNITVHVVGCEATDYGSENYLVNQKPLDDEQTSLSEAYVTSLQIKRKQSNIQKATEGKRYCGYAPYGYRYVKPEVCNDTIIRPGYYEVVAEEYPYVIEIFRRVRSEGLPSIVTDFNRLLVATGEPLPPGKNRRKDAALRWNPTTLDRIVKNPFYAGIPAMRQTVKSVGDDEIRTRLSRDDWKAPDQPLDYQHPVTLDEWNAIQTIIASRRSANGTNMSRQVNDALLVGLLYCPNGKSMYVNNDNNYGCKCKLIGEDHAGNYIDQEVIDAIGHDVLRYALAVFPQPGEDIVAYRPAAEANRNTYQDALDAVVKLKAAVENIVRVRNDFPPDVYQQVFKQKQAELNAAQERERDLRTLEFGMQYSGEHNTALEWLKEHSREDGYNYEDIPLPIKRGIISLVIARIDLLPSEKWHKKRSVRITFTDVQRKLFAPYHNGDDSCKIVDLRSLKPHYKTKKAADNPAATFVQCDCGCGTQIRLTPSRNKHKHHFANKQCWIQWKNRNR